VNTNVVSRSAYRQSNLREFLLFFLICGRYCGISSTSKFVDSGADSSILKPKALPSLARIDDRRNAFEHSFRSWKSAAPDGEDPSCQILGIGMSQLQSW
jgi:hypothetical protein